MQDKENKGSNEMSKEIGKVYELGFLLIPSIKEEDVSVNYGNLKELIISLDGEIISGEIPKMINLAYPMTKITSNARNKFDTAYFGWVKFEVDAPKVLELKKHLDLDPSMIRFLILKTVKENTIATKRFTRGEAYKKSTTKESSKNEMAVPIDKEEIDKEIDALVTE